MLPLVRTPIEDLDQWDRLARCRAGDRDAHHAFAAEHFGLLARFFQNKVSGELDSLDLVSSTIARCVETSVHPGPRAVLSLLLHLAIDELLAYHRARHGQAHVHPSLVSTASMSGDHARLPMRSVSAESRLLLRALRRISLEQQIALELLMLERLDESEIARLLELPLATVRRQLWMGKQRLWAEIADAATSKSVARSLTAGLPIWADEIQREVMAGRETG